MKSRKHQSAAKRLTIGNCSTGPITAERKAISSLKNPSAQGVSLPVVRVEAAKKSTEIAGQFESQKQ